MHLCNYCNGVYALAFQLVSLVVQAALMAQYAVVMMQNVWRATTWTQNPNAKVCVVQVKVSIIVPVDGTCYLQTDTIVFCFFKMCPSCLFCFNSKMLTVPKLSYTVTYCMLLCMKYQ